jgi:hypothetical protein
MFQVGDVMMVEKPVAGDKRYWQADIVAKWTQSNVVHAAIVSEVPPLGTPQNGGNVFVVEALKGNLKKVVRTPLVEFVGRYPWGGIHIRRVDNTKFPFFAGNAATITTWLNARVNDLFDTEMINPVKRAFTTGDRYISIDPWCETRKRAFNMYLAGRPNQWICSQLVAWALAFPGGLNTNVNGLSDAFCPQPHWIVKDLQPNPGDYMKPEKVDYMGPVPFYVPCDVVGCFTALSIAGNTMVKGMSVNSPSLYVPGTTSGVPTPAPIITPVATTAATTTAATTTAATTTTGVPAAATTTTGVPVTWLQLCTGDGCCPCDGTFHNLQGSGHTAAACQSKCFADIDCTYATLSSGGHCHWFDKCTYLSSSCSDTWTVWVKSVGQA